MRIPPRRWRLRTSRQAIVAAFREAAAPGSYLALSHVTFPQHNLDGTESAADVYKAKSTSPAVMWSPEGIRALFGEFELVDPGLVYVPQWRPESPEAVRAAKSVWMLAGVATKP